MRLPDSLRWPGDIDLSNTINDIVYTGHSGSIGSSMPEGPYPLHTRLEHPIEEMKNEICSLSLQAWAFVHLAGLVSVRDCEADPDLAYAINVEGAKKWFQASCQSSCQHFVFVSSSHVFAPPLCREVLTPESPVGPRSVYSKTKLAAENALKELAEQYPNTKLTIARVFSVLSEAMRPGFLLTNLHNRAKNKDFSPIPGLSYIRDFLEAPAICQKLLKLTKNPAAPNLVLICSGSGRSIRQITEQVFTQYGLGTTLLQEAPRKTDDIPYIVGLPSQF